MFILSLNVLLAQNLFQNSSFESTSDQSKPREDSELEYATPWQDDKNIIRRGLLGSICRTIHSPDYFKCNGTMKLSDILYYQNNPNLAGG
jgi:CTP:phosphocholine cytidylyltransferase-like protein